MKKENIILTKTYDFALKIVKLYLYLKSEFNEFELSRQVLRSGTSIGANSEEGNNAQSKKDFISKFSIALKEANETHYWLRLLRDSNMIEEKTANDLLNECSEIIKIISSIVKTSKEKI
ncbi:MAG: four helix bundle protein [Bacteroidales bacterium]|nr:four helix bundle protein [Bacteroidales bacterium]